MYSLITSLVSKVKSNIPKKILRILELQSSIIDSDVTPTRASQLSPHYLTQDASHLLSTNPDFDFMDWAFRECANQGTALNVT